MGLDHSRAWAGLTGASRVSGLVGQVTRGSRRAERQASHFLSQEPAGTGGEPNLSLVFLWILQSNITFPLSCLEPVTK